MSNLLLAAAASGAIRNAHLVVPNGATIAERTLLLELAGANLALRSQEFATSPWAGSAQLTVGADVIEAPDGTLTGDRLTNDGTVAGQGFYQPITFTADGVKVFSIYLMADSAPASAISIWDFTAGVHRHLVNVAWTDGVPGLTTLVGSGVRFAPERARRRWYRCAINADGVVAANANFIFVYPTGTGSVAGSVYAWGAQPENARFASSYMRSEGSSGTREADTFSIARPSLNPARALSVYTREINIGHGRGVAAGPAKGWWIGPTSFATPAFGLGDLGSFDGKMYGFWHNGSSESNSAAPIGAEIGDAVETLVTLSDAGVCQVSVSVNDGAVQTGAAGSAVPLSALYATPVHFNLSGPGAYTHAGVFERVLSFEDARRLAGRR